MKVVSIVLGIILLCVVTATVLLKNVAEGDEFSAFISVPLSLGGNCQFGLTPVFSSIESSSGSCAHPMCDCYVCTKCGDGVCGKGENHCNCESDCDAGEGESKSMSKPEFHKTDDFDGDIRY